MGVGGVGGGGWGVGGGVSEGKGGMTRSVWGGCTGRGEREAMEGKEGEGEGMGELVIVGRGRKGGKYESTK